MPKPEKHSSLRLTPAGELLADEINRSPTMGTNLKETMNDQKIYALMINTPSIRAVQIADALDQDLTDVSAALRSLVEVGDIVQSKGFSPNGHPAQVYNLSDNFKKSPEYKRLTTPIPTSLMPAPAAPPAAPAEKPPVAPAVVAAPAVADAQASAPASPGRAGSKVSIAVAYLEQHGAATDSEMRRVLNIGDRTSPSSYLAAALRSGRVRRDGGNWLPGDGKATSNVATARQARAPREVRPTKTAQPELRCALWSDGSLELQRGGTTLALLAENEVNFLTDYLAARTPA